MTDEEIIARVQGGERHLFEELHRRHYQKVWRFARRSLLDPDTASDIAGECFLRAYRSIDRFRPRPGATFAAFLFRIASNLMADRARRASRCSILSLEEEPELAEHLPDPSALPLDQLLRDERLARVRVALDKLPITDRQILMLSYEQDLSAKDIAAVMNKPSVSAVTSHLHRALCKLRTHLLNDDYFSGGGDNAMAKEDAGQPRRSRLERD